MQQRKQGVCEIETKPSPFLKLNNQITLLHYFWLVIAHVCDGCYGTLSLSLHRKRYNYPSPNDPR